MELAPKTALSTQDDDNEAIVGFDGSIGCAFGKE